MGLFFITSFSIAFPVLHEPVSIRNIPQHFQKTRRCAFSALLDLVYLFDVKCGLKTDSPRGEQSDAKTVADTTCIKP
jgi:hypothetical protein